MRFKGWIWKMSRWMGGCGVIWKAFFTETSTFIANLLDCHMKHRQQLNDWTLEGSLDFLCKFSAKSCQKFHHNAFLKRHTTAHRCSRASWWGWASDPDPDPERRLLTWGWTETPCSQDQRAGPDMMYKSPCSNCTCTRGSSFDIAMMSVFYIL